MPPAPPTHGPLPVAGFSSAGVACGIKANGNRDLLVVTSDRPATVAGVFTLNRVQAAPLHVSRQVVTGGVCRAVVINSGNANACTGDTGLTDARSMVRLCAHQLDLPTEQVAVCSTGVIGAPLPMTQVEAGIADACGQLSADGWADSADALRTTDLVAKAHTVQGVVNGREITLTAIAKGSGMIHPNMATMLGLVATDASITADALQAALSQANGRTFNRISVDGDTSTNDCVLVLANGQDEPITCEHPDWAVFADLLEAVLSPLAQAIVADGEGATKLVTVQVEGAQTELQAEQLARQIARSSLVKTALFGNDPNWGRIVAAAGQAAGEHDIPLNSNDCSLQIAGVAILAAGKWLGSDAEAAASEAMLADAYTVCLRVGDGDAAATMWTCDLSYDYVRINAEYRT